MKKIKDTRFEEFRFIHIPGHTPGSMSVLDNKNGVLFF